VVNEEKSAVNRPWVSKYLGFRITRYMGKTRIGMQRGAARKWAVMVGNTRKGAWRLSKNGMVCAALPDDWFTRSAGVLLLGSFCQ